MSNNVTLHPILSSISEEEDNFTENDSNHNLIGISGKKLKCKLYSKNDISIQRHEKMNFWILFKEGEHRIRFLKIISALFYAISSFLIIVINKVVLTTYKFPSFHVLGIGQMLATLTILLIAKKSKIVTYPSLSKKTFNKIFPLPLLYVGNLVLGLGGTKKLSLPMFTVLRRFAILMTLIGEYLILNVAQRFDIILTVLSMIAGTIIAASHDLAFDLEGYVFVLGNDFFTAANGVFMKKKLNSKELGKYGLLFYNCLFMVVPIILLSFYLGEFNKVANFESLYEPNFLIAYFSSCVMGFVLMYSTILCTSFNSALTTTIVGCLKNILVTYVGMYIGGDYVFSWTNFIGVNISMIASIAYSYLTLIRKAKPSQERIC